ncbi:MAG: hypothetical protein HYX67_11870 [Candidatus Melainabacteria bacterium]|nr:hypothetical protein [Candidatus Melainabacteria bacterium]
MTYSSCHVLFISESSEESREAASLFLEESTKAELAWSAVSGVFSDIQQLQTSVDLIILLEHIDVPHVVPASTVATEHWRIENATTIKQNISNLIVRLILKGGKRQPVAPTSGNAATSSNASKAAAQAAVRVALESKGRGGKKVSVISGLPLTDTELDDLTTKLKRSCGTGGTFKDGQIEIQGDHRDKLMAELQKLGYKPKRKGG